MTSKITAGRLKDFAAYVLISLIFLGSVIIAAVKGVPDQVFKPWFGFTLFTLFLFGQFVFRSRRLWKRRSFWLFLGAFFIAHVLTVVKLMHTVQNISGQWFVLLTLVEMIILLLLRRLLFK